MERRTGGTRISNPARAERTVLVTGCSGLIGSRLSRALAREHRVLGLDRDAPAQDAPIEWVECDLTDDASTRDAVAEARRRAQDAFAGVVHLAAYYDFSGEPSPLYETLTVEGARRLLHGLQGAGVQRFVFSSSLLVMQPVEQGEVLTEHSNVAAAWDYPRSKLAAEAVVRNERGTIPAAVLRLAGVYDEDGHSVPIAQQMSRIFERRLESFFFPGDADSGQSFVHLEDAVEALRAALRPPTELEPYELFLVGEPEVMSYAELQDVLGQAFHGRDWPTLPIPAPLAKAGAWIEDKIPGRDPFIKPWMVDLADAHRPVSIDRARIRLGWSPGHRLRETVPEMARHLLADPAAWYDENGIDPPDDLERRARAARRRSAVLPR